MDNLILLLKLFPLLLQAILAIEAAAPIAGAGAAKLELLTSTVRSGFTAADFGTNMISQNQFLAWLQAITASIVTFYNILGIFKTTT
jgi:hypothetical protein